MADNPNGKRDEVLAIAILFLILTWISVGLRCWVRATIVRAFGWDDWTMLGSQLLFTAYLACQLGGLVYGTGRHLRHLEYARAERAMSYWFFCELFYILATSLLKVSVGFFLLRVAVNRIHVWIIRVIMAVALVFGTGFFFVVLFQCAPIRAFWTLNPDDGQCIKVDILMGLTYTISSLNVIADWTFGLLPIWIVKDLQMSKRQKQMVAAILAFAAIGSTATVIRLPFVGTLTQSYLGWNGDFLYDTVGLAIWTTVEMGIGITAGCVATLRPLFQMAIKKLGLKSSAVLSKNSGVYRPPPKNNNRRAHMNSMSLGGLDPSHGVVTTITGNHYEVQKSYGHHSRSSSQEYLAPPPGDISKFVTVETDEYELKRYDMNSPPPLPPYPHEERRL